MRPEGTGDNGRRKVRTSGSWLGNVLMEFQSVLRSRPDPRARGLGALSSCPLCPGRFTGSLSSSPANLQPGHHGGPKPSCALLFRFLIIYTQQGISALSRRPFEAQLLSTRMHAGRPPGGHIYSRTLTSAQNCPQPHRKAGTTSPARPKMERRNPVTNHSKNFQAVLE